jgi:beta-1,2-mannobiose phosphorylase / 1,2-beta-oligomannan phosphorylase
MFNVKRDPTNPILLPNRYQAFESLAVFNWSPVVHRGKTHVFYRAVALPEVMGEKNLSRSTIGHGIIKGHEVINRSVFIEPQFSWERYGCEDPRVTKFEQKYYIFYTAISEYPFKPEGIKVAVAVTSDLKKIEEKHLVTPFNAKAMALFPERINGKIAVVFSLNPDSLPTKMAVAYFDKIEDMWSPDYWNQWKPDNIIEPRLKNKMQVDHIEVGAPPIKTKHGWLYIYSYIKNYTIPGQVHFGISALLLDLNDPTKIIGQHQFPFMVPSEFYEKYGHVPNIVFPSGALIKQKYLDIYYGAADTSCCLARVNVNHLLESLLSQKVFKRFEKNPILTPGEGKWERMAAFNPTAIDLGGKIHILYRAMSDTDATSTVGYANSLDGLNIDQRLGRQIYYPRESFEKKKITGNSGCEDARVVKIKDRIYMFYTAFDGGATPFKIAATSIAVKDFLEKRWRWDKPHIISPDKDKNCSIFPEKIKGLYPILHRLNNKICLDYLESLDFSRSKIKRAIPIAEPRPGMWDSFKIGISGPPIKTKKGWLLFYHGIGPDHWYRVGAMLLDKKDPSKVLARTNLPLLEPEEEWEKKGIINNVVFPCGSIVRQDKVFIYYGGSDKFTGVATASLKKILQILS